MIAKIRDYGDCLFEDSRAPRYEMPERACGKYIWNNVVRAASADDIQWNEFRVFQNEVDIYAESFLLGLAIERVADKVKNLLEVADSESMFLSSLDDVSANPAFVELVSIGHEAIPYLLDELESMPILCALALHHITGDNPVREKDRGDVDAMVNAWQQWARQ